MNVNNSKIEAPPTQARQTIELISFLMHEFKTPLTSIITSAGLLAEELPLSPDDPKTRLISNILTSAYNLEARASELLDLAKLEAEGFQLELEPADINTVIYNAVDQISPTINSRNQSLTLNLAHHLPKTIADSLRIEQVLLNLLSNATKFTPEGGSISLTSTKQNDHIVIKVQDSGSSIPLEEQTKVFQLYYRLRDAKEHIPGTGLGLTLCKHLIELHGGTIWVESQQSKGSTFAFSLPLKK